MTTPICPCHNEPCVWTSYNKELVPDAPADHWSCSINGNIVSGFEPVWPIAVFKQAQADNPNLHKYFGDKEDE